MTRDAWNNPAGGRHAPEVARVRGTPIVKRGPVPALERLESALECDLDRIAALHIACRAGDVEGTPVHPPEGLLNADAKLLS